MPLYESTGHVLSLSPLHSPHCMTVHSHSYRAAKTVLLGGPTPVCTVLCIRLRKEAMAALRIRDPETSSGVPLLLAQ